MCVQCLGFRVLDGRGQSYLGTLGLEKQGT